MEEKQYHDLCRQLFADIEQLLEAADADFDNDGNVIEIITDQDDKIIINKQTPMREVWLATKQGGRHFRLDDDGEWRDTRDNSTLMAQLNLLLSA